MYPAKVSSLTTEFKKWSKELERYFTNVYGQYEHVKVLNINNH